MNKKYTIEEIKTYANYWLKPALCTDMKDSIPENERLQAFMYYIDKPNDSDNINSVLKKTNHINKYKVITLCGSTKFKDEFLKVQKELTLQGHIVISVGLFGHADGDYQTVLTEDIKVMLDDMHKRKIDLADEIFVINKNGYIGSSTKSEIEYAIKMNKKVNYLEQ